MPKFDWRAKSVAAALLVFVLASVAFALASRELSASMAKPPSGSGIAVDADGTVHLPPLDIPFSSYVSPEAKAGFLKAQKANQKYTSMSTPNIAERRQTFANELEPALERARALYPVDSSSERLGGVYTDVIEPKDGVAARNRNRVLINLHGGAFLMGARIVGALESAPVASLGKIKVVTVDYREGPEYQFPAASEDVAAVYRELLKSYESQNIGIYGCSAGGVLTAEATAWILEKENLPAPGAIGIFCGSADGWGGGDSGVLATPLQGIANPPDALAPPHPEVSNTPYFNNTDFSDPLVMPIHSDAILGRFPPTLIITSTRDVALSGAVYTHTRLDQLGVNAELHVWEGLRHAFFVTEPDLPESRQVWDVVVRFFDAHLGKTDHRSVTQATGAADHGSLSKRF